MTINFEEGDRELVAEILGECGLYVDYQRVADVLYNVEAAFQQQLEYEIKYMINDFEV